MNCGLLWSPYPEPPILALAYRVWYLGNGLHATCDVVDVVTVRHLTHAALYPIDQSERC